MYSHLALSNNGFLFDPQSGKTYTLNSTGSFLLKKLIDGKKPTELRTCLAADFEVPPAKAAMDVDDFLLRLQELRIGASQKVTP